MRVQLEQAHKLLQVIKAKLQSEEAFLFKEEDSVWLENRRSRGENPKLQAKFVSSYTVVEQFPNHTYQIDSQEQTSL